MTSQKSAILPLDVGVRDTDPSAEQGMWLNADRSRRSRTLCCVGLVFNSPAVRMTDEREVM